MSFDINNNFDINDFIKHCKSLITLILKIQFSNFCLLELSNEDIRHFHILCKTIYRNKYNYHKNGKIAPRLFFLEIN